MTGEGDHSNAWGAGDGSLPCTHACRPVHVTHLQQTRGQKAPGAGFPVANKLSFFCGPVCQCISSQMITYASFRLQATHWAPCVTDARW